MKVNIADVERRYRAMTDEDLLGLRPADLTTEARLCRAREAARRGLLVEEPEPEPEPEPQSEPEPEPEPGSGPILASPLIGNEVEPLIEDAYKRIDRWGRVRAGVFTLSSLVDFFAIQQQSFGLLLGAIVFWLGGVIAAEIFLPLIFRGKAPILWLRKFRRNPRGGKSFEFFLFRACDCLGTPLTIQDQSYSYSYEAGMGMVVLLLPGVGAVFFIAMSTLDSTSVVVGIFIGGMVALFLLVPRWFGYKRVADSGAGDQVAGEIEKIKDGWVPGYTAAVVLRCSATSWRTVVKRAQQLATLVVIDVTDISENVLWEMETAVSLKAPQSVILAHRIKPGDKWEIPASCAAKIREHIEAATLAKMPVFLYPASESQLRELSQPPIDTLRRIVARALMQTEAANAG